MSGAFFDFDLLPYILKGLGKAAGFGIKAAVNELTKPEVDEADDEPPVRAMAKPLKGDNSHGFILDANVSKDEAEDGHIMVVGGVGSGKTSCIAIPTLLSWNERAFVIDIKGELYEKTRRSVKRRIAVFHPLNPNALGYDPFYELKYTENQVQEAQAIAHALIPLPPQTVEPFWIESARNLFVGAILHYFNMKFSFTQTVEMILLMPPMKLVEEIFASDTVAARLFDKP